MKRNRPGLRESDDAKVAKPPMQQVWLRVQTRLNITTFMHACMQTYIHPSVCPPVHPSVRPSVHPSIHPASQPASQPSIHVWLNTHGQKLCSSTLHPKFRLGPGKLQASWLIQSKLLLAVLQVQILFGAATFLLSAGIRGRSGCGVGLVEFTEFMVHRVSRVLIWAKGWCGRVRERMQHV